jgi:hypothetical protein
MNNLKRNNMEIKPAYVTFEQAKWLKEKGFDVECKMCVEEGDERPLPFNCGNTIHKNSLHPYYSAPEQWQVVEWLRVNHGIWITVTSISQESWQWHITKPGDSLGKLYEEDFYSPQEAYEAAIEYCLRNLI